MMIIYFVQHKRTSAPSSGNSCSENQHKLQIQMSGHHQVKQIFLWLGDVWIKYLQIRTNKSSHHYSSTINIYFILQCIIVQGISRWKKMYKADLKYSNFHSNYWRTGKKVPFEVKQIFYKHPKLALTGIPTQLQCMLVIQKHNTRIQFNTKLMSV